MIIELLLLLGLILLNGFFALSEMAIVASRKSSLKQRAVRSRAGRSALALAEHPENFLSAVQIGITLVGILTGVIGGATLGVRLAEWLHRFPLLAAHTELLGIGIAVVGITYVTIVLGELIPKRLALLAPERIAQVVAWPMTLFARLTHPFVLVLSISTRLALRLFGSRASDQARITEEEIRLLVAESAAQGEIEDLERSMINRALRLGDRSAESLMTPRNRIAWLDTEASLADNLAMMRTTPYASYPVMRGSDREVLGILNVKSLIDKIGSGGQFDLFRQLVKPLYVPESTRAFNLLAAFRTQETRLALVVDEYGDLLGLVTQNDVLTALLGTAVQTHGESEPDAMIVQRPDGSYLLDGALKIEDLRELLSLGELPGESEHEYKTLAGMLIAIHDRIPLLAEICEVDGYRFEVVDLDGARVDKVLVSRVAG